MRTDAKNLVQSPLCALSTVVMTLALTSSSSATAQQPSPEHRSAEAYQTLYVAIVTDPREVSDLVNDLRNMLPMAKIYRVESANAISVRASAEDFAIAQKILADIDQPRKTYRLTYTITDSSMQSGSHHFSMLVESENKTSLKQGQKVPIVTGSSGSGSGRNSEVQYMDIGMNLDATPGGARRCDATAYKV
jgi:type II secretory pathway component GspD/PulD (secretin)